MQRARAAILLVFLTGAAGWVVVGLAATAGAACVANRCGPENEAVVEALRAEVQAACDCRGSATHQSYTQCVKDALRSARRGAAVYRVPSRENAIAWLSDPAFTDFRRQTGEDVIVLVQAGL